MSAFGQMSLQRSSTRRTERAKSLRNGGRSVVSLREASAAGGRLERSRYQTGTSRGQFADVLNPSTTFLSPCCWFLAAPPLSLRSDSPACRGALRRFAALAPRLPPCWLFKRRAQSRRRGRLHLRQVETRSAAEPTSSRLLSSPCPHFKRRVRPRQYPRKTDSITRTVSVSRTRTAKRLGRVRHSDLNLPRRSEKEKTISA